MQPDIETLRRWSQILLWVSIILPTLGAAAFAARYYVERYEKRLSSAQAEETIRSARQDSEAARRDVGKARETIAVLERDTAEAREAARIANERLEAERKAREEAAARRRTPPLLTAELGVMAPGELAVVLKSQNGIPFEYDTRVVTTNDELVSGLWLEWAKVFPTDSQRAHYQKLTIQWQKVRDAYLELKVRYRSQAPEFRDLPGHAGRIVRRYRVTESREVAEIE
jgi:hypothetical protein